MATWQQVALSQENVLDNWQVGSWASLGGSEAAADFLELKQQAGMALLGTETTQTCTEAEEQEADTWNDIGIGLAQSVENL